MCFSSHKHENTHNKVQTQIYDQMYVRSTNNNCVSTKTTDPNF